MKQSVKPFNIHFVCRGNIYRSRLAAAYMRTLLDDRFKVTSSGTDALNCGFKTVGSCTSATAKFHKLNHGIKNKPTQTTDTVLASADVIVFMSKDVYDEALRSCCFDARKALVWHVADLAPGQRQAAEAKGTQALIDIAAGTFASIRRNCNKLAQYLTHTSWVDIVDADNHQTGLRLPMAWATDRGLWHRGVHVVVQTHDGKFVVGKRGKSIVFAPGMLEISLGGGLDTGETPLQAAVRETHEELGIKLPEKSFRPLFVHYVHSFHPRYNKRTRGHVYTYAVTLPIHHEYLRPQPGEVEELRLLTKRQVKHMLRTHRVAHFGRLTWRYRLYQKAVAYSLQP